MLSRIISILLFSLAISSANSQSTLDVFDRKTYLDIRCEISDIPALVKKYASSSIPIHLDFSINQEDNLNENHFSELAKLPLTHFRFSVWIKTKFYCKGLEYLQSLDSLELCGYSHSFLEDASKLKELQFLQLEIFRQDSTINQKTTFNQIKKMRITLSEVYDLSQMFDSLPKLKDFDFSKSGKLKLSPSMAVLNTAPIEELCFGLCSIDTTNFKTAVFPNLKKAWLIGVSSNRKDFGFTQFIQQNPTLEFVDITMNGLSKEFAADLREKFPVVNIKRDY